MTVAHTYPENAYTNYYISMFAIVELINAPSNDLFNARTFSNSN